MTSVKIILRTKKTLKNGEHPIALRFIKDRKIKYVHLSYGSLEEHWDFSENLPNRKHPNKNLANYLEKEKTKAVDARIELDDEGKDYSVHQLVERYRNDSISVTVMECFDERIKGMKKAENDGNANVYTDTKNAIKDFDGRTTLMFTDIDFKWLQQFVEHMQSKGNSPGGISVKLRTLRAIYNYAIKSNYVKLELYPFKNKINHSGFDIANFKSEPARTALTREEIDRIRNLDIDHSSELFDAWNYFLFSYYTRGMNFEDMVHLKHTNISGDRMSYIRSKTGKRINVELLDPAKEIVNFYKSKSPYVFPILSKQHKTSASKKNRSIKIRAKVNKDLKKIASKAEIKGKVTFYIARHTWAMVHKTDLHTPIPMISDGLGHNNAATTQAYLDGFQDEKLDEVNKGII
jgi:site-specific recombinase XerD